MKRIKILGSLALFLVLALGVNAQLEVETYCENGVAFSNIVCSESGGELECTYDKEICDLGCDGDVCAVCTDTSWTPDLADYCADVAVLQTSNCGTERTIAGTKTPVCEFGEDVDCGEMITSLNECHGCYGSGIYCSEGVCEESQCVIVETQSIEPTKDSKVARAQPSSNFGSGRYMMVNDNRIGTDRAYLGFDLSGQNSVSSAELEISVVWTGGSSVGQEIEAWVCPDIDFDEHTLTWNNQPVTWDRYGNPIHYEQRCWYNGRWCRTITKAGNGCTLADSYTITHEVVAGLPETKHTWDLTTEVNEAINNDDKKFTVVLKHDDELHSSNSHYVQYLTKDNSEASIRPSLEIS